MRRNDNGGNRALYATTVAFSFTVLLLLLLYIQNRDLIQKSDMASAQIEFLQTLIEQQNDLIVALGGRPIVVTSPPDGAETPRPEPRPTVTVTASPAPRPPPTPGRTPTPSPSPTRTPRPSPSPCPILLLPC